MTIEQIIEELRKERNDDIIKCNQNLNAEEFNFYKGRSIGINRAIHWLKYLKNKEGE